MTSSTGTGAPTGKMRPDTAKSRLAAAVLALAAGIGSASAAWDGQSWVYDTSGRVDSSPSLEIGTLEEDFNSIFRTFEASPEDGVDGCFMSSETSLPIRVSTFRAGTFFVFR